MESTLEEQLIRRLVAGDRTATEEVVSRAASSDDPVVLIAVALLVPSWQPLLSV